MKRMLGALIIQTTVIAAFLILTSIGVDNSTSADLSYPMFQKGMSYVTWSSSGFASPASDASIRSMSEIGVKCVAIIPTWYQDKYNSTEIAANDRSPSDQSIRHAIRKAHSEGMFVMLKPHIDLTSDEDNSRSDIGFSSDDKWSEWFNNYTKFITHYAKIARDEDVEFFCVGTELTFAATKTDMWKNQVIPEVRKAYKGRIMYAANWDEYENVGFWDDLDYAGIDAYFPLADKGTPQYEEIRQGWRKWAKSIGEWAAKVKKPVLFTECGYASVNTAAVKPWQENKASEPNQALQADCYKALLEELWNEPWFFGLYWWSWNTYAGSGGVSNKGFTPQNKPAAECIKEWYKKNVEKNFIVTEADLKSPVANS